jgi:purine nucleosidase
MPAARQAREKKYTIVSHPCSDPEAASRPRTTLINIAEALQLEPELPRLVQEITIMGAAAAPAPGNLTPVAEANIDYDPEAAALVLSAGWTVALAPLDVTMTLVLEENHR